MKKNKETTKKYIIGLLTIFLGIVLIAIGFIFYKNYNQTTKPVRKVESKEQQRINYEESKDKIPIELLDSYTEIVEKTNYFDIYFLNKYDYVSSDTLSSYEKTLFLLNTICNATNYQVSTQDLISEMTKYFSPFDLYLNDIQGTSENILYKYANGVYTYNFSENNQFDIFTKEISNEASYDNWIMTKKIYYVKGELDGNKMRLNVYRDPKSEEIIYSFDSKSNISVNSLSDEEYEKIENKLNTVTYTYKRNDNKYILENIVKN